MENQSSMPAPSAPMSAKQGLPGISALFNKAKEDLKARKEFFLTLSAIPVVIQLIGVILAMVSPGLVIVTLLAMILSVVVALGVSVATINGFAHADRKDWKAELKTGMGMFFPVLFTAIILSIVVGIGYILLIIPGIYLTIATTFYMYTLVLEDKKYWDAAKASMELVKGYWWSVLGRLIGFGLIIFVIMMILGLITGITGSEIVAQIVSSLAGIVITPLSVGYMFHLYKALKEEKAGASSAPKQPAM